MIRLRPGWHPKQLWLLLPLRVELAAGPVVVNMVLDTGSGFSAISSETLQRLGPLGARATGLPNRYLISGLSLASEPLKPVVVRRSDRIDAVGAEGILGLDFLLRFARVTFDRNAWELLLEE